MAPATRIPLAYKVYFQWADPIISGITVYMLLFHKDMVLASFNPLLVPRDPKYDVMLWACTGMFAMITLYHGLLLRYTDDVGIWKITNLGVLVVDFMILGAMLEIHFISPELSGGVIRLDDWGNYFLTGLAIVMRLAFIFNVCLKTGSIKGTKGQ